MRRLHAEIASSAFLDYLLLYWAQMMRVEEIARDIGYLTHDPPHTYMVVAGHGFHIDLSRVYGELCD